MTDEANPMRELKEDPYLTLISKLGTRFELVCPKKGYKAKTTEHLAEWLILAGRCVVDENGLLLPFDIPYRAAWQIARLMQAAKIKVPHD